MDKTPEQLKAEHEEAVARAREANSTRNAERLKAIEAIADQAEKIDEEDEAERTERLAAAEAEDAAKALQTEGATIEPETQEALADEKVINGVTHYLTVVNGHEKWLTLKQLRETSQKVESADEYLQSASEAVRNASRQALSKQDEPVSLEKDEMKKLLASVALGDDEAMERLASVLTSRPSEVTPDVVRTIDQRLSFRTELATLESKSKDLLEDKYMGRLFRDRLNEMKAENPTMTLNEAYTSIDKELRTAFPARAKADTQTKLERKRTLVNVPTAASRQVEAEDEEGEEDVSSVIDRIAKARHATAVIHGNPRRQ